MTEMRREYGPALLVAAVAVALAVAGPASGVVLSEDPASDANATSGESLAGAIASHGSELEGEMDRRELAAALERTDGDASAAAVLADRRLTVERRAQALADRREALRADREAGEVPPNAHRVEMARLSARAEALRALLAAVANESDRLPADLRSAYGLDDDALNRSRTRAAAAVPTDTVGDDVDAPTDTEADLASARNATERAVTDVERRQRELETFLESLAANGTDEDVLACSRDRLAASRTATDTARDALAGNDSAVAESSLVESTTALRGAYRCLVGVEGTDALPGDYDFDESDYGVNDSEYDAPTWNDSDYGGFDGKRTPTPTPTYPDDWTWDGKSTPTRSSYTFETPTETDS